MFRGERYLEKTEYVQVNLNKALTIPGNGQHQTKPTINSQSPTETTGLIGITPTFELISLSKQPRMVRQLREMFDQHPLTVHFH